MCVFSEGFVCVSLRGNACVLKYVFSRLFCSVCFAGFVLCVCVSKGDSVRVSRVLV